MSIAANNNGNVVTEPWDSMKVFSATKQRDREILGESITDWRRSHPNAIVTSTVVTQSSDSEFHCFTVTVFYKSN